MEDQDRAARLHEVDRGQRAKQLLENPLFVEAFEAIERELVTQWKQNTALGQDGRERCFLMVTLLGQLRQHLTQHVQTGDMAAIQLREHKTMRERLGMRSIAR